MRSLLKSLRTMSFPQTISHRELIQRTGAVYTPPVVVRSILSHVRQLLPDRSIKILEPSVGDGAFLSKLGEFVENIQHVTAIDIDENAILQLREHEFPFSSKINFVTEDFSAFAVENVSQSECRFDLVVGNPPFIKKRNFSDSFKESLRNLSELSDYPNSKLKNAWAAFWVASTVVLSRDGVLAFVLPYELMTVSYGHDILRQAQKEFERVDIFISRERAFRSIDQDAVVFIGQRKSKSEKGTFVNAVPNFVSLSNADTTRIRFDEGLHNSLELNSFLLDAETLTLLRKIRDCCFKVGDYSGSAPGIVSGANNFFIIEKEVATLRGLEKYTLPILKKNNVPSNEIVLSADIFSDLSKNCPAYLLKITPEDVASSSCLQDYVREGNDKGIHLGYKCRNREYWYKVPIVKREKAFLFKRSHNYPKLHLNEADVYLTDTAYGLRINEGYSARGLCYSFYNSLTLLFAETDGRFYGGGVLELSPTEFRGLPLVYNEPTDKEFREFLDVHKKAKGDIASILNFGDRWLRKTAGLNEREIRKIREALYLVRAHRFRHSGHSQNLPSVQP